MSDAIEPQEFDEEALFRAQFDPQQLLAHDYRERGSLESLDFDFRGPVVAGKITQRGVAAKINRIIMYFSSQAGDYLRSEKGNEFKFIYNAPINSATQFRILATTESIMRRRFPDFTIDQISADQISSGSFQGWSIRMSLRHSGVEGRIEFDLPLGDEERLRRQRNLVQIV